MKKFFTVQNLRMCILGFLAGACPLYGGVYPFGAAYLCAAEGSIIPCFIGAFVSACVFGSYRLVTAAAVVYTAAIRLLFSKRKHTFLRCLLLSLAYSALLAVTLLSRGGYTVENIVSTLCITLIPVAFSSAAFFKDKNVFSQSLYILSFGFIVCRVFSPLSFFGIPVATVAAVLLTSLASKGKGFPLSGVCGFIYGIAGGLYSIPVTGIYGLVHGLFCADAPVFSLLLGFMLSATAGAYILSFDRVLPIAGAMVIGILLFLPFLIKKKVSVSQNTPLVSEPKLSSLAAGFSSLSGLFFAMSDLTSAPARDVMYPAVKDKLGGVCLSCGGCDMDKEDIAAYLTSLCCEGKTVLPEEMPASVREKCPYYKDISLIPTECLSESVSRGKETFTDFGTQYKCFSNMLAVSAKEAEKEQSEDDSLVPKVESVLNENGVYFEKVRVTGVRMRKVEVFGVHPDSIRLSSGDFSRIIARAVGRCVCPPEFVVCGEKVSAVFTTVPALRTESVKLVTAKDGETLCGDTVSMFENGDGYFYSLVADGMGSGREANMVSRLASLYLEKIIGVGGDMNSALLLLGDTLSRSPGETFTTVDMLEADRVLARAKIVKAGAPPSFLLRGDKQYIIKSRTPPMGIIKEVVPEQTTFSLKRGDIVLMVSDGVDISPSAISKAFSPGKDLRVAATTLTEISRKNGSVDDMSVCAVRFY